MPSYYVHDVYSQCIKDEFPFYKHVSVVHLKSSV